MDLRGKGNANRRVRYSVATSSTTSCGSQVPSRRSLACVNRDNGHRWGLTQDRLAAQSGLHRTYISDVERGARNPSLQSIARFASALNLPIAALFPLPGPSRTDDQPHSM